MANEWSIIELIGKVPGCPIRFTCAEAVSIAKGTLLELTDPRTVIANTNDNAPVVGVCAFEKVGGDGSTTVTAYTNGIFSGLMAAGAQSTGKAVANSATENTVQVADAADFIQGSYVGYLLADTAGGVVAPIRVLTSRATY
jgi:hypothetical protein